MMLFLDANVLFTAAYAESGVAQGLFALAERNACRLFSSAFALDEASRNLALKTPDRLPALETLQTLLQQVPEPPPELLQQAQVAGVPSKDAPVLAAAAACGADWLVTGDRRDFGHLLGQRALGVLVLAPRDALTALLNTLE
jgi:predicted nucleic acid-binding protein